MTSPFTVEPYEAATPTSSYGRSNQSTMGSSTPNSSSSMAGSSSPHTSLDDYFTMSPCSPYTIEGSMDSPSRGRKRRGRQSVHELPLTLSPVLEPSSGPPVDAPPRAAASRRGSSGSHRGVSPWGQPARGSSSRAKLIHEGSRARRPNAPLLWPMAVDGGSSPELSAIELRKERRSWSGTASPASPMTPRSPSPLLLDGGDGARHGLHAQLGRYNDLAAEASRAADIAILCSTGKQKMKARSPSDVRPPNEDKMYLVREIDVLKARYGVRPEDGTTGQASQPPPSVYRSPIVSRSPPRSGPSSELRRSSSEHHPSHRADRSSEEIRRSYSEHRPSFPQHPPQQGSPQQQGQELLELQVLRRQLAPDPTRPQTLMAPPLQISQPQPLMHLPLRLLQSQTPVHPPQGTPQARTLLHPPHRVLQPQQQGSGRQIQPQQAFQHQLQLQQQGPRRHFQPEQQAFEHQLQLQQQASQRQGYQHQLQLQRGGSQHRSLPQQQGSQRQVPRQLQGLQPDTRHEQHLRQEQQQEASSRPPTQAEVQLTGETSPDGEESRRSSQSFASQAAEGAEGAGGVMELQASDDADADAAVGDEKTKGFYLVVKKLSTMVHSKRE
ncbi:hypothetical protein J3F83DRAFT_157360 [Trichoderma novae-zelandiae]